MVFVSAVAHAHPQSVGGGCAQRARGYGIAMAFWLWALKLLLECCNR